MAEVWELVKEVTQPTRKRSVLSVPQIAARLGVSPVTLYKWGEPSARHQFPARLVGPLTRVQGDLLLVERIAQDSGCVAVPVNVRGQSLETVSRCVKEFGEFIAEVGTALDDGELTRDEAERIVREGYEMVAAGMAIVREAERVLGVVE